MFTKRCLRQTACGFHFIVLSGLGGCLAGGGGGGNAEFGGAASEFAAQTGLAQVAAQPAYSAGLTGKSVRVGVLDSGIDAGHSEFSGRLHPGLDFQGSSDGRADPNGHGTHVASILAGAKDGAGMHGIAPQAELYAYRILDSNGYFGRRTGEQMIPSAVGDARTKNLQLLNNSWGSSVEIDDITKGEIQAALPQELSAWQQAVGSGMVMIWAAGNDRDNQVSVRAGLPHYFSGLRPGWLTVVSSGADGREPVYTNRCGLAASWCLTAPGGGDNQPQDGIWAAQTGGGYTRKSGTSMSAPHVSGGLALVMQAFPTLSAQGAAARLLRTASYDGLVTANGCTFASCGEARMRAVFGQGQMDLAAALAPVLGLSYLAGGRLYDNRDAGLFAGPLLYGPMRNALKGQYLLGIDSFDGARFRLAADDFIIARQTRNETGLMPAARQPRRGGQGAGLSHYIATDTILPSLPARPQQLADISPAKSDFWYMADHSRPSGRAGKRGWTLHLGQRPDRLAFAASYYRQFTNTRLWFGQGGADEKNSWLDSRGSGPFYLTGASSYWQFAGLQHKSGPLTARAEMLYGNSRLKKTAGFIHAGTARLSGWQLGLSHQPGGLSSRFGLTLSQPVSVTSGTLSVYDSDTAAYKKIHLAGRRADKQLQLGWTLIPDDGIEAVISHHLSLSGPGSGKSGRTEFRFRMNF